MQIEPTPHLGKVTGDWRIEIGGSDHNEGNDEAGVGFIDAKTRLNLQLTDWLRARAVPYADFASGRAQERFDDELFNTVGVREAYLSATPFPFLDLRAGVINQEYLNMPQLVSTRRAFPGAQENLKFNPFGNFQFEVIAEQVIPTSISLNSDRMDKEKLPSFQTQSLHLADQPRDWISWDLEGGHFQWNDMPSKVAFWSQIEGNSVDGEISPDAQFRYGFNGFFWGGDVLLGSRSGPQPILEYQGVVNTLAPAAGRDARSYGIGVQWLLHDVDYRLVYRSFYTEPDASVAYYNLSRLGSNNRQGDEVQFKIDFLHLKFAVLGEWVNARTINDSSTQFTWNYLKLGLETHYAPF